MDKILWPDKFEIFNDPITPTNLNRVHAVDLSKFMLL